MEPFSITCETCRARLKIRSASAIGEIHSCPRCGSMVQIIPPTGWTPPATASPATVSSSPAAVLSAVSAVSPEPVSPAMQFAQVAPPSEEAADAFAEAAALAAQSSVDKFTPTDMAAEFVPPVAHSLNAVSAWLLSGGVVATVLVVGGLAVAMLRGGGSAEIATSPPDSMNPVVEATVPASDVETKAAPDEDTQSAGTSAQVALKPVSDPDEESDSAADNQLATSEAPADSVAVEPMSAPITEQDDTAPAASAEGVGSQLVPTTAGDESARPAILRFDPLDFDPTQLTLSTAAGASTDKVSTSVLDSSAEVAEVPAEAIEIEQEVANLPDVPAENPSITVRLGPIARGETSPVQVARQLGMRVESLAATGMSLEQFVAFVADLAAVPITIDPLALELAGVSPRAVVAIQTSGVTLEELARNALSKHRLQLVDNNGRVQIALAKSGERSTKRYDVSDLLATGAADASDIARVIEQFVSPATWQAGGRGTIAVEGKKLRVDQTKDVHHELLIFCERWRLSRGLAQRSQYPANRLSIAVPYPQVESKLGDHVTFTFLPWTRLDDVVRHWAQATGLTILVDWSQLATEELAPNTPIACSAVDRPWNEALGEIFEPLGLAWWAVDGQTIQITTQDALDGIERTEFYAVPKTTREQFDSKETFLESLQSELRQHVGDRTGNAPVQFHVDSPSGRLIVRGTPAIHRYLAERLSSNAGQ